MFSENDPHGFKAAMRRLDILGRTIADRANVGVQCVYKVINGRASSKPVEDVIRALIAEKDAAAR